MRRCGWLTVLALAGCSSEKPVDKPRPTPTPTAHVASAGDLAGAAIPAPELAGATVAVGRWSGDDNAATFGQSGKPAFAMRCEGKALNAIRYGAAAGAPMTLATDRGAATYPTSAVDHGAAATIAPVDAFLDVLLKPGGTLGVRLGNDATLAMPLDATIGTVIRNCRPPHG